jgi:curved DNA-binding protein CbpA
MSGHTRKYYLFGKCFFKMSDYVDDDNLWKEDLFATLGVSHDASDSEIKKTYLKLAKKFHPDRYVEDNEEKKEAQRIFSKITVAYNTLIDPGKRNHYLDLWRLLASHLPENQSQPATASTEKQEPGSVSSSQQKSEPAKVDDSPVAEKVKEDQARSFFKMGQDYMKKNNLDKAIDSFKQAISIKSDIAEFHSQLGQAYKNKNWIGMSQSEFKLALKYNPHDRIAKSNFTPEPAGKEKKTKNEPEKKGLFGGLFNFGKKK